MSFHVSQVVHDSLVNTHAVHQLEHSADTALQHLADACVWVVFRVLHVRS